MGSQQKSNQQIFRRQPIMCPWITSQPYHSSGWSKNRSTTSNSVTATNQSDVLLANNNHWGTVKPDIPTKPTDKVIPSIQQSSSQFFYFLRLMQLFPETHPATLHTVLNLCKNDFFCAVDKLLYAKRCRLLCFKKSNNAMLKTNGNNGIPTANKNPATAANDPCSSGTAAAGMNQSCSAGNLATFGISGSSEGQEMRQQQPSIVPPVFKETSADGAFAEKPADLSTTVNKSNTMV